MNLLRSAHIILCIFIYYPTLNTMSLSLHAQTSEQKSSNRSDADQALFDAFKNNDVNMMQFAIQELHANIDVTDKNEKTLLELAVEASDMQRVFFLVSNGAKLTTKVIEKSAHSAALREALENGQMHYAQKEPVKKTDQEQKAVVYEAKEREEKKVVAEQKEQEQKIVASQFQLNEQEQQDVDQSLRIAALRNDFKGVQQWCTLGAQVNAPDQDGTTALMCAVHASPEMVEKLIKLGASVDATDNVGKTACNYAEYWLLQGAQPWNGWDIAGILSKLIAWGATPHALESEQTEAFKKAVAGGYAAYEANKLIVEGNRAFNTALAQKQQQKTAQQLKQSLRVETKLPIIETEENFVHEQKYEIKLRFYDAVQENQVEVARALACRYGSNPDIFSTPPVFYAITENRPEIVKALIDDGYDVNVKAKGLTPLSLAFMHRRIPIAEILLASGARLDLNDEVIRSFDSKQLQQFAAIQHAQARVSSANDQLLGILMQDAHLIKDLAKMVVDYL